MTFNFAVIAAKDYWASHGVTIPCRPQRQRLTWANVAGWRQSGYDPDMITKVETCTVLVHPRAEWYRVHREFAWLYCREVAHELGHLAGLEHDDPRIDARPWGCTHPRKFLRRSVYAFTRDGF